MAVGSVRDLDLGRIGGWCEVQGPILGKTRWQVRDSGPRLGIDVAIVRYIVLDWEKKVAGASLRPGSYGWKVAGVRFRALDWCRVGGRWEVHGPELKERKCQVQGQGPRPGRDGGRCDFQGPRLR